MSKSIKILSIISVVISCLGILLAVAILTFLWKPANILLNSPEDIVNATPIIPIGNTTYILGSMLVAIVLLVSSKTKKFIAIEVLSIVFLSIVLPILPQYLEEIQYIWIGSRVGFSATTALSYTNNLMIFPHSLMNLSLSISLITSGMRITEKVILNNQ